MALFILSWIFIVISIANAQTTYNPSPEPTDAPTSSPTLGPIKCHEHGRPDKLCNDRTIPPTKDPASTPITPVPLSAGEHTQLPTPGPINDTLTPTLPTVSPTEFPLTHGRKNVTFIPTNSPPSSAPTEPSKSPVTHDLDTNFPSKIPSYNPTIFGDTRSPSRTPTISPTPAPSGTPTATPSGTYSIKNITKWIMTLVCCYRYHRIADINTIRCTYKGWSGPGHNRRKNKIRKWSWGEWY